jgi:hypothetical protein
MISRQYRDFIINAIFQQQLTSGQQQTLLFMVNNTAPVAQTREGKKSKEGIITPGSEPELPSTSMLTVEGQAVDARAKSGRKERRLRRGAAARFNKYHRHASPANQHVSTIKLFFLMH